MFVLLGVLFIDRNPPLAPLVLSEPVVASMRCNTACCPIDAGTDCALFEFVTFPYGSVAAGVLTDSLCALRLRPLLFRAQFAQGRRGLLFALVHLYSPFTQTCWVSLLLACYWL